MRVKVADMWDLFFVSLIATGLIMLTYEINRSQIRDLQRRVAVLEQQVRR